MSLLLELPRVGDRWLRPVKPERVSVTARQPVASRMVRRQVASFGMSGDAARKPMLYAERDEAQANLRQTGRGFASFPLQPPSSACPHLHGTVHRPRLAARNRSDNFAVGPGKGIPQLSRSGNLAPCRAGRALAYWVPPSSLHGKRGNWLNFSPSGKRWTIADLGRERNRSPRSGFDEVPFPFLVC